MTTMLHQPARRAAREVKPIYQRKRTAAPGATIVPQVGVTSLRPASEAHAARMRARNERYVRNRERVRGQRRTEDGRRFA